MERKLQIIGREENMNKENLDYNQFSEKNARGETSVKIVTWLIAGAAVGATAAYFWDPARGKRRRHVLRDQSIARVREAKESAVGIALDVGHRVRGIAAEAGAMFRRQALNDDTLNQRIRSEFGRKIRHARSIDSFVKDGVVTLAGPILAEEVNSLLRCVRRVRGVRGIVNQLQVSEVADSISGLQGAGAGYLQ
jgi:osmotically-inducible protein OsmY